MHQPTDGSGTGEPRGAFGGGVMLFMARKKRFKFDVKLIVDELSMVPFVNGVLFAKVRLLNGGNFSDYTNRVEVIEHKVRWLKECNFVCKMVASVTTGVLEQCNCRVSVRKELKGGRSYLKLGYADIDLAQFAGSGCTTHRFLLDGYSSNRRQDNSILKIVLDMTLLSGDPCFKVRPMRKPEPILVGDDLQGGALHSGNKGACSDCPEGDGIFGHVSSVVNTNTDPLASSLMDADLSSSSQNSGHSRTSSDQSKISSGYCSTNMNTAHSRQSSADAALVYRHNRTVSGGSSDTGSISRLAKKTDTQPLVGERRLNLTRVNNNELVDEVMNGIDFNNETGEDSGLQLFVNKDGTTVLGSSVRPQLSSASSTLKATAVIPKPSSTHTLCSERASYQALYHTK